MYTFRFDDISANLDMKNAVGIAEVLRDSFVVCEIMFCVSMLYDDTSAYPAAHRQWVFEPIKKAKSDYRNFYKVDGFAIPKMPGWVHVGSHGLVHVDHRLLDYGAQELSIVTSCSLLRCQTFVPPFNWWDADTEDICEEFGIRLVKFEEGWRSIECNPFSHEHRLWYLHSRNMTPSSIEKWLEGAQ